MKRLSDEVLGQWFRSLCPDELELLKSFGRKSWGTAYRTIAEVQVVLRIGKTLKMNVNFATHSVSPGSYFDEDGRLQEVQFAVLGWHLNGQADGTWTNKLTFFFAVYHFLQRSELATKEVLGNKLWDAREAMRTWGVSLRTPASILGAGACDATFSRTKLHRMIREYMENQ